MSETLTFPYNLSSSLMFISGSSQAGIKYKIEIAYALLDPLLVYSAYDRKCLALLRIGEDRLRTCRYSELNG